MSKRKGWTVLSFAAVLSLVMSAAFSFAALADDGAPPTEPAVEEPVGGDPPAEEPAAGEPPATEAPLVEQPPAPAELPVATEIVVEEAEQEPGTLPELLAAAPEDTSVVVLDASGESIPLATEDAAAIFVAGDPTWCPGSERPGDAGNHCMTGSDPTSLISLMVAIHDDPQSGPGTIYIADDYNYAVDGGWTYVTPAPLMDQLTDLTLQGGWDFSGNQINGVSTLNDLQVDWRWGASNSFNIFDVQFAGELTIYGVTGDLTLGNVQVLEDAFITNVGGEILIEDSDFQGDDDVNLGILTEGDVTIRDSHFDGGGGAAGLGVASTAGSISLENVTADGNAGAAGIGLAAVEGITLHQVSASGNEGFGAALISGGPINVTNSDFNSNVMAPGLVAITLATPETVYAILDLAESFFWGDFPEIELPETFPGGGIHLENVNASGNASAGIVAASLAGPITLQDVTTDENLGDLGTLEGLGGMALVSLESITLNSVYARMNDGLGAVVVGGGPIEVNESEFSGNGWPGLVAGSIQMGTNDMNWIKSVLADLGVPDLGLPDSLPGGDVTVSYSTITGNGGLGAGLGTLEVGLSEGPSIGPSETHTVRVLCSTVTGNDGYGLALAGNAVLQGNDLSGNYLGEYTAMPGTITTLIEGPCGRLFEGEPKAVVSAPACPDSLLDEGEVTAKLHNLCSVEVTLEHQANSGLPGDLPLGSEFGFGISLNADAFPPDGYAELSFPIPSGADTESLAVLSWNGTSWQEVSGGSVIDGWFVVIADQPGLYVLVTM